MEYTLGQLSAEVEFVEGIGHTIGNGQIMCASCVLFIFVKSGVLGILIDGKPISCTSGEFIIAVVKQHHEIVKCNKKVLCCLVKIQWQFIIYTKVLNHFIENLISKGPAKLTPDHLDRKALWKIMKLLHHFYSVRSSPSRFSIASFNAALHLLVFQAGWLLGSLNRLGAKKYNRKEMLSMHFLKLLIEHFRAERNMQFYADSLCVTKGYLYKAVKEVTGRTVGACIAEIVINESKYLLETSDDTLELISEKLNFSSPGSFCRFFKKFTNTTPNSYRRGYHG